MFKKFMFIGEVIRSMAVARHAKISGFVAPALLWSISPVQRDLWDRCSSITRIAVIGVTVVLCGLFPGRVGAVPKAGGLLQLEITLRNGKRITAVPSFASLPVRAGGTSMKLPLTQIMSISMAGSPGGVVVAMRDGNTIRGTLEVEQLELGERRVAVAQIMAIKVKAETSYAPGAASANKSATGGVVLHYTFDQDAGDTVRDLSGMNNHGKLHGVQKIQRGSGGALDFSGGSDDGDFIEVPHSESLVSMKDTGELTLCAWLKVKSVPREFPVLFCKGGSEKPMAWNGYELMLNANMDNDLFFASGDACAYTSQARGRWIRSHVNEWMHVAFTLNTTTGEAKFYVNGQATGDENAGGTNLRQVNFNVSNKLYIGGSDPRSHRNRAWFDGALDEVMVYKRVLMPDEILSLYESQKEIAVFPGTQVAPQQPARTESQKETEDPPVPQAPPRKPVLLE